LNNLRKTGTVAAVAFSFGCSATVEGIRKPAAPQEAVERPQSKASAKEEPAAEKGEAAEAGEVSTGSSVPKAAFPEPKKPDLDPRLEEIAEGLTGSDMEKVNKLHARLNASAPDGVKAIDMRGKAPRTASEALDKGGDCTDLARIVVPVLKRLGIPGGVLVVHFNKDPADVEHMVPYAIAGGKEIIIDLQSPKLGKTADGRYTVVLRLTYDEAKAIDHQEDGDYKRDNGKTDEAIAAYEKSLEVYEGNAYVHQNLGVLYEKQHEMKKAAEHLKRAAELDPRYRKEDTRGSYNEEVEAGHKAYNEKRWADCAKHFRNALNSGEKLKPDEKKILKQNIEACEHNHEVSQ